MIETVQVPNCSKMSFSYIDKKSAIDIKYFEKAN